MARIITYLDDNRCKKKLSSLKRYNMIAYKYIAFDLKNEMDKQKDGKYIKDLYTDKKFKKLYGQIQIAYTIKDNVVTIENILPDEFLLTGYMLDLKTYKGIPYRDNKDLFKIQVLKEMGEI